METRLVRNIPALSAEEQEALKSKRVLVVGCGGLGGCVIEYLLRLGVGEITAVDGDVFEESNLNRQLLSQTSLLGMPKALAAAERARAVAPSARLRPVCEYLTEDNAAALTEGQDLVIDALDSPSARLLLEEACAGSGVTLVHGAVRGWRFQSAVIPPASSLLRTLYGGAAEDESAESKTCLAVTCACCAAVEAAEAVKLLCGRESSLRGKLLLFDLATLEQSVITL